METGQRRRIASCGGWEAISDDVETTVHEKERRDSQGNPLSLEKIDEKWALANQQTILHHLKKAIDHQERNQDKETR